VPVGVASVECADEQPAEQHSNRDRSREDDRRLDDLTGRHGVRYERILLGCAKETRRRHHVVILLGVPRATKVRASPGPAEGNAPVQLTLVRGDITDQHVDAIVNAANSSLLGGGGVDGAIHRRGGAAILRACEELRRTTLPDGLPTGQAVATTAGKLPARWVIHTVGPVYAKSEDRSALLASAYRESLRVADELGARAVAFPAVSAGVYGWPLHDAARIAVRTVQETAGVTRIVGDVRFVLFSEEAYDAFAAAQRALPD